MNMVAEGVKTTKAVLELAAARFGGDAYRNPGREGPLRRTPSPPGRHESDDESVQTRELNQP